MRTNRVALWLATLAALMATAVPAGASPVSGPDPAVEEWPRWPYLTSCGSAPPFDPVTAFSGPTGAEEGSSPSAVALRGVLNDPALAWLGYPKQDWRSVSEDGERAEFIWGRLGKLMQRITLQNTDGEWKWLGSGTCELHSLVGGRWAVDWSLAAEQPGLRRGTRQIRIELQGGPCSSGMSQNDRAHPVFRQMGRKLLLSVVLDPLPPGAYTCQGVVEPPLVVKLPGRLGKRQIFAAGIYPPRLAAETRPPRL